MEHASFLAIPHAGTLVSLFLDPHVGFNALNSESHLLAPFFWTVSTVRMADQIVVLAKGQMIESGSHQELMQLDGHYAHLFEIQAKGYQ